MKIGLAGYQGSGKSTLFHWLTGVQPDPASVRFGQSAMAVIAEPRLEALRAIYHSKKATPAALEIVDTPGLSRSHQGNASRLALIREAGCLVLVVAAFDSSDPAAELRALEEDLLLADMEVVSNRIARLDESFKKPRPKQEREQATEEMQALRGVLQAMEQGRPLRLVDMTDEQARFTRAFRLLTEKPKMVVVNMAEDDTDPARFAHSMPAGVPCFAAPLKLELELHQMSSADRAEFQAEFGVGGADRDQLIRTILDVSGQHLFFTANDKEVRSWLLRKGGTALEAAEAIHSDLARGFIRAEVVACDALVQAGSEREAKAHHLVRQEPKDYVLQDDEIVLIRFSV